MPLLEKFSIWLTGLPITIKNVFIGILWRLTPWFPQGFAMEQKGAKRSKKEQKGAMQSALLDTFKELWCKPVSQFVKPKNGHFFCVSICFHLFPFVSIFPKMSKSQKVHFEGLKVYGHKKVDPFFGNESIMQWIHFFNFFSNWKK